MCYCFEFVVLKMSQYLHSFGTLSSWLILQKNKYIKIPFTELGKYRIVSSVYQIEIFASDYADQRLNETHFRNESFVSSLYLSFSWVEAAEDDDDDGDGDGEGYAPQEEDEGGDSGGYYEEEEAEGEPYESQPASESGHSMPDFTADVDINKSDMMSAEETKPVPVLESDIEDKQGNLYFIITCSGKNIQYETFTINCLYMQLHSVECCHY